MASKPRKPRRSTRELFDEALANVTIDAGDMDANENVMSKARKPGRPPHDWPRIDVVIDFYLTDRKLLTQDKFIASVRAWIKHETDREPPDKRTLERRIQLRAQGN